MTHKHRLINCLGIFFSLNLLGLFYKSAGQIVEKGEKNVFSILKCSPAGPLTSSLHVSDSHKRAFDSSACYKIYIAYVSSLELITCGTSLYLVCFAMALVKAIFRIQLLAHSEDLIPKLHTLIFKHLYWRHCLCEGLNFY